MKGCHPEERLDGSCKVPMAGSSWESNVSYNIIKKGVATLGDNKFPFITGIVQAGLDKLLSGVL